MTTRTVTGTYLGADGQPLEGRLYFAPVWRLTDPTEQTIVLPVPATVDLDASGGFSVDLLTTDSANPAGWVWEVTERVGNTHATWHFALPADGNPLDLADVAPAEAPTTGALTYASGSILPATTNADDGAVLQVFGPNKTPQWSDNLTAYGNRIDSNDARLNDLEAAAAHSPRVTHPNTDDVLAEVWDSNLSRWQTVHYDTGTRDIRSLMPNARPARFLTIRRINNTVFMAGAFIDAAAASAYMTLPAGFKTLTTNEQYLIALATFPSTFRGIYTYAGDKIEWPTVAIAGVQWSWATADPIPTTLPGTKVVPAPASAPAPDGAHTP